VGDSGCIAHIIGFQKPGVIVAGIGNWIDFGASGLVELSIVSNKEPSFSPARLAIRSASILRIADSSAGGEMLVIATKPLVEKD
jgi:hypothetical protein